jgi:hypothetical protein
VSKGGHTLLACAIGGALVLAGRDTALLGIVTAAAGRIPDSIEIVTGFGPNGERHSIVPHRTVSHSPYPYIALLIIGLLLPHIAGLPVGHVIAGIGLGGCVHVAIDLLSPSGVPLGNPFGSRASFGPFRSGGVHPYLYRTSTAEEWPVLLPFAALLVVEAVFAGSYVAHFGWRPDLLLPLFLRG